MEEERAKTEKKSKKKKKTENADLIGAGDPGLDVSKSPELVEHKVHKQKKKKKSKKSAKTNAEEDLLGLSLEPTANETTNNLVLLGSNEFIKIEVNEKEISVENNSLSISFTITNIGQEKLSHVSIYPTNSAVGPSQFTKSLKPGKLF